MPYNYGGYELEDFSQQKINSGQQEINGLIKIADERIGEALKQVKEMLEKLVAGKKVDSAAVGALKAAIDQVDLATKAIAGPFPPGCGGGGPSQPPPGDPT